MSEDLSRRRFIFKTLGACAVAAWVPVDKLGAQEQPESGNGVRETDISSAYADSGVSGTKSFASRKIFPPSAGTYEDFENKCTGCMLCASVCEGHVIKPNATLGKVEMDFDAGFCVYACNACASACPSFALKPMKLADKLQLKIALARLRPEICLNAKNSNGLCALCEDVCPASALGMVEYFRNRKATIPDIEPNLCVGCGACAHACPSKAIVMTPVERAIR